MPPALIETARDVRWQVTFVALLSAGLTAAFAASASLQFGYRAPALHVALETSASVIGLLVAFLVFGRLRRSPRLPELLLTAGFSVQAVANFWFRAVPAATGAGSAGHSVWLAAVDRLAAALLIAAAAVVPMRPIRRVRRTVVATAIASTLFVAATFAAGMLLRARLPDVLIGPSGRRSATGHPGLDVHPALLAVQLFGALIFSAATVGFARRARRRNDPFLAWLALACVLSTFSRLNYFLYPSNYSDWIYLGDVFWLAALALLLVGALLEIAGYWRTAASAAALEERRRLARDLHDGLAQELAFLRRNMSALADGAPEPELVPQLRAAAERAEREARRLLGALTLPAPETFDAMLASVLGEVVVRERVRFHLDAAAGVHLDPVRTEALLRIAAEAVSNAARHAGVDEVSVRFERLGERVRLAVVDRGCGFDPEQTSGFGDGFGLSSMRQRARAISAELCVRSRPGRGTVVEVVA